MDKNQSLQILNRDTLKIIAAAAMLIDHIGWRFYPFINLKAQVFHVLGRITLPIMCLFLTEGYFYTRSKKDTACGCFCLLCFPSSHIPCFKESTGII